MKKSGSKNIMKIILIMVYLVMTVAGLVLMKYGKNPGSIKIASGEIAFSCNFISGIGLICYLISFILFTRIVVMFDLSYIYPIVTGIVQILSLIASKVVFNEKMTIKSIIGATVIIVGIIIMNMPNGNIEH